jgi:hypothetical protein
MDKLTKHGWHWTFGWLRRPELDQSGLYCYEEPNGDLVFTKKAEHKSSLYLDKRRDEDADVDYFCFARIPRRASKIR